MASSIYLRRHSSIYSNDDIPAFERGFDFTL